MPQEFSIATARDHFLSLREDQIFFDNAGGSQVLAGVGQAVQKYLLNANVQLGASYATSKKSTELYGYAYEAGAHYINASPDEVVFGASTTQIFRNLSFSLRFQPGDEIILSLLDHESNIDPWLDMAERQKLTVKWWKPTVTDRSPILDLKGLQPLLSEKTRFVACTHASNVLGSIHDVRAIVELVHTVPGALLCVDGVAYAPHRKIDVKALGVDFYAFSWYKVYGPHLSMLYGHRESQYSLKSLGHHFNPSSTLADKLNLAGSNYELLHSIPVVIEYLGTSPENSWNEIAAHEEKLQDALLAYLVDRTDVTIYGIVSSAPQLRVPTISFTVRGRSSKWIVEEAEKISNLGFRWGHFYSYRLVDEVLGLPVDDGVVRVSMVHYNTVAEVEYFVQVLDKILG